MGWYWYVFMTVLFYCSTQASTDSTGFLRFVSLNDIDVTTHTLPRGDNHFGSVQTNRIPFGNTAVYSIYISTNGYFSMGERPQYISVPNFPIPNDGNIVAPYGADIDTSTTGRVRYADFSQFGAFNSHTRDITNFIRANTFDDFFLTKSMVVAEWDFVHHSNGQYVGSNTFQGIVASDGEATYAVFIYECGGMQWGGGVIGWQASSSNYVSHSLSGKNNSNNIGCLYSNEYSAIIYRISACDSSSEYTCDDRQCIYDFLACNDESDCTDGSDEQGCVCESYEFTCDNGDCIFDSDACDDKEDCSDGSDEQGCPPLGELAIIFGVCGGVFVLLAVVSIAAVSIWICHCRRHSTTQTTIITQREPVNTSTGHHNSYPLQSVDANNPSHYGVQQAAVVHPEKVPDDYFQAPAVLHNAT